MKRLVFCLVGVALLGSACGQPFREEERPRVIVTSDGEIDDECSMVRFLLYTNEWDVEAIVTSSSQYHWHGHNWAGDDWIEPYFEAYEQVYPNLVKHDRRYPKPETLRSLYFVGNVESEGEMEQVTPGSRRIVDVLLDESDSRPVWIQAWGGTNTLARALKTIEEEHPEKMEYVASKCRFFFIWEQDETYQKYIRPVWEKYGILTIISDQFEAIAYRWRRFLPKEVYPYFESDWTQKNIVCDNGPLCALYKCRDNGEFRSEGDSPSFMHQIVTGLRNLEHPDWGGWAGRYDRKRANVWFDRVTGEDYVFPEGRYYSTNSRSRFLRSHNEEECESYFRPISMWAAAFQNDFAARADWCVKSFREANHQPVVKLRVKGGTSAGTHPLDISAVAGETLLIDASASGDPDRDDLSFRWFVYDDAGTCHRKVTLKSAGASATLEVPSDGCAGETIHVICEATDNGTPALTRYQRVVVILSEGSTRCAELSSRKIGQAVCSQLALYPQSRLQDIYKSFFQAAFGAGHMVTDTASAGKYLDTELLVPDNSKVLFEPIGADSAFFRVHLCAVQKGYITRDELFHAFLPGAVKVERTEIEKWRRQWTEILQTMENLSDRMEGFEEDRQMIEEMLSAGHYAVHHSERFSEAYDPHYRIIRRDIFFSSLYPALICQKDAGGTEK